MNVLICREFHPWPDPTVFDFCLVWYIFFFSPSVPRGFTFVILCPPSPSVSRVVLVGGRGQSFTKKERKNKSQQLLYGVGEAPPSPCLDGAADGVAVGTPLTFCVLCPRRTTYLSVAVPCADGDFSFRILRPRLRASPESWLRLGRTSWKLDWKTGNFRWFSWERETCFARAGVRACSLLSFNVRLQRAPSLSFWTLYAITRQLRTTQSAQVVKKVDRWVQSCQAASFCPVTCIVRDIMIRWSLKACI